MALKTVAQLKDSVAGLLSGIDMSNVDNLDGALERAARTVVQKADVPEASGTQNIVLYNGVIDYNCDTKIFGTAINDIRPQGISRSVNDYVYKKPGEQFDRTKKYLYNGTMATFEYVNGVPIIRIIATQTIERVILDMMNSITGWTASGSASTVIQDNAVYYQAPASLRFTLTGSSSGQQTKTLDNSLDLSSYEDVGVAFLAIRIPDGATATNLTSISLKLGSNSTNYDIVTSTTGFLGSWTAGEWLLVAFDFAVSSSTGTPDWSAIDYVQVGFAHTGTFTNFRIGGLWISQPSPAQILYQSAAIFKAGTATASTEITADTDTILLNDPAYTIYEYESAMSVLQQSGASEATGMMDTFKKILNGDGNEMGLYKHFTGDNPSQELRTVGNYYDDNTSSGR